MPDVPPATIVSVVGARPQLVKAWVVSRALAARGIDEVVVHTGQHWDARMSEVFFDELGLRAPAHELGVAGGGHGDMTGRMLVAMEPVLEARRPRVVLVYGDTNSTLAGALAAAKLGIAVAHVEAGLRSFNRAMPEEVNRVVTDHVSSLLFCPTRASVDNLEREGVRDGVVAVGDVMYDASIEMSRRAPGRADVLARAGLDVPYSLATVHRAENTSSKEQLSAVAEYLAGEATVRPVVLPLHPRTRDAARQWSISFDGVHVCDPVGPTEMTRLVREATCVLTDSGGLQKEAYFHRVPCVTLRDETEWVETVAAGWNRLWHTPTYLPRTEIDDYGDGHAGERIAEKLERWLSRPGR